MEENKDNMQSGNDMPDVENPVIEEVIAEGNVSAQESVTAESEPVNEVIAEEPVATALKAEQPKQAHAPKSKKRILQGKVVSNKPDKTIVVSIVRQVSHPIYKKYYKRTNKFLAHDELNECKEGDTVRIRECRPLSARKRWELIEIVERAK